MMTKRRFSVVTLVLVAVLSVYAIVRVQSAHGGGGAQFVVDTNLDSDPPNMTDGLCSLREAIMASNTGATVDTCEGQGPGADGISFNIGTGTPTISVDGVLPNLTDSVSIDGHTGGADRIELDGDGGSTGLYVASGANFSTVRSMVVNGFQTGIYVFADYAVVAGNFVGTNSAGTQANANSLYGIDIQGKNATVGGTNGTSNSRCQGDCNLVSGNAGLGIYIFGADGAVIQGNYVGTDVTGKNALPNGEVGINTFGDNVIVGGPGTREGNLISGNTTGYALSIGGKTTVQGNRIGTDRTGMSALPNYGGIFTYNGAPNHGDFTLIGGPDEGDGNLISGNDHDGVEVHTVNHLTLQRNLIGTQINGTSPLGNGLNGVSFQEGANNNIVGGEPEWHNTIAFNQGNGVAMLGTETIGNRLTANSIHSNGQLGIELNDGNNGLAAPVIAAATASGASGTSCAMCVIEVFSDSDSQGRIYEGNVVTNNGSWTFTGSLGGPKITVTATDPTTNDTSEFSLPFTLPIVNTPTPSPTPTHSPTPSPTHTPSNGIAQGDVNCDHNVDETDFSIVLAFAVSHSGASVSGVCPTVGANEPISGHPWGDVTCDDAVNAKDALWLLAHTVEIELPQPGGCTHLGEQFS